MSSVDGGRATETASTLAPSLTSLWSSELLTIVLIGGLLRLKYLTQPMRYDESVTYLNFVARPWAVALSSYTYPNNHVFHTLLAKACVSLIGSDPWVLRLPAFIAGIAMIPWVFVVGRRLVGTTAAYLGTALVAASGPLTLYSTNARGYTIVCLFTLILLHLLLDLREKSSIRGWIGVVVVASLGMWTIPVMLYPAGGLLFWFVLSAVRGDTSDRRGDLKRSAIAVAAAVVVSVLLYSPILSADGAQTLVGNQFVRPSRWRVFFAQVGPMIGDTFTNWSLGLPVPLMLIFVACGTIAFIGVMRRSANAVLIVGSMYVWCAAVLLATHHVPFARVWLPLLAPADLLFAYGLVQLSARLPNLANRLQAHTGNVATGLSTVLAALVVLSASVSQSRDTGTLPDAQQLTRLLARTLRPGDRVIAPLPSNAPLAYYFEREGVDTAYLSSALGDSTAVYLVVNSGEGFTVKTPVAETAGRSFKTARLIARYPAAELYRLF